MYVVWSQVGLVWKRSHVSLKHLPPIFVWKQLIKTDLITSCCSVENHSGNGELHCTKWDSHNLLARKKTTTGCCLPAVFQDTRRWLHDHDPSCCAALVYFHICVYLPHKGTCSHVADCTCNTHTNVQSKSLGFQYAARLFLTKCWL